MKRVAFLLFLFYSVFTCQANIVKGKVIDLNTKKPLAFVHLVYDQGIGTTTNIDGKFVIDSPQKLSFIDVSYLGYFSKTVFLNEVKDLNNLVIELKPKVFNFEEVVVLPGVNPAEGIIKKVFENRDLNNPEKLESFSCVCYHKMIFTLEKDTQKIADSLRFVETDVDKELEENHLFLIESVNKKDFIQPGHYQEKVIASKVSGLNDPLFSLAASQVQSFSFYNEYFNIFDKLYVNPIGKGSIKRYLFILEDTLYNENKDSVFVISFRPRRGKNFTGLKGFLHVNSNQYAIQSVVANPLEKDLGKTIRIKQNYEFVEGKQWFPKELITDIVFDDGLSALEEGYSMVAHSKSYVTDVNLKPELKKKFGNTEFRFADDAHLKTEEYWMSKRITPLSETDKETYRLIDSISKAMNFEKKLSGFEALMSGNIPYRFLNLPLNKIVDFNKYEGLRLGIGFMTNKKVSKHFSVGAYCGYGFRDEAYKYGGDVKLFLHKDSESTLHFSYSNDVKENGGYQFFEPQNLSSSEVFRKFMIENMDMIENYEASFSFLGFNYLKTSFFVNESYVSSTSGYGYGENLQRLKGDFVFNEAGVQLRYAFKEKYIQTLKARYPIKTKYPVFCANVIWGNDLLNGEYIYRKLEAKLTKSFQTKSWGKSKLTITGGWVDGDVPLCKLYNGHGSYDSFTFEAENSFGTMHMGEFYSNKFLSVFFKHDFGNVFFRTEHFSPKFALVHNYGIGELNHKEKHFSTEAIQSFDKGFYECGILINNILTQSFIGYGFGVFYRYGPYSFVKTANNFAYKISLTFNL